MGNDEYNARICIRYAYMHLHALYIHACRMHAFFLHNGHVGMQYACTYEAVTFLLEFNYKI